MEETISLQEIFKLLKKKAVLIASMFFVGIGLSALITFFVITPKYSAGAQLIATSKNTDSVSTDNINSNLMMINTYKDFIKGRVVTEAASKELAKEIGFTGTSEDVKNMINVEQTQSSQMFTIVVTSENPKEAATVANVVANIFKDEAGEYTDADKVSVISEAETPKNPVSPNKTVNLALGGILGIIIGVGLALLSQLFNRTIKSTDFVTENLGISILGQIPLMDGKDIKDLKKGQPKALADASQLSENIASEFSFDDEVDGLDQDLTRISSGRNVDDTIDLSDRLAQFQINEIDLSDMDHTDNRKSRDSVTNMSRRSR